VEFKITKFISAVILIVMSFIYNKHNVVFEIPTAVIVQITVERDVTPCTLISAAPTFKLKCNCTEDFITTFYRNVILYKLGASMIAEP
jgi:hypothetical protein